ncbi:MAG: hypothetical protein ABSD97_12975 [Acidimicrobiales bacterium]|jgi:hypothetical protein
MALLELKGVERRIAVELSACLTRHVEDQAMLSPATAIMMARARQAEVRRAAERSSVSGIDEAIHGRHRRFVVADSPSARRLLVSKTYELVRLADSLGCKREELVRMIESSS